MMILKTSRANLSSNDQLSLDLPFAATKSLTARVGPTPTFTRASSATFVGSNGLIQSAAINIPRFDHTSAGVCRGLLIEESRTNLLQRSEEFANAYWSVVRSTITTDAATSPDGATTAEKLIADTTAAINHRVDRGSITLALNTVHTVSVFAKASEYTGLGLGVGLSATEGVRFSLVGAGTATSVLAGNTGTIQQLPNGWYRCTCTFTSDATTATHRVAIYVGQNGTTTSYTGDGTSGIFIWGAQLEVGSFATSYIPTTTASVVRSADVCSITGANFTSFYNQTEGTLFADITPQSIAQLATVLAVNSGSSQNQHGIYKTNAAFAAAGLRWGATSVLTGFVTQAAIVTGTDVAISRSKLSYAYKLDDFSFAYAGTIVGTDTSGTLPSPTTMQIGNRDGTLQINGHLASIRYYKKRLPNAKLQALTA
jgi:hypothetical protein